MVYSGDEIYSDDITSGPSEDDLAYFVVVEREHAFEIVHAASGTGHGGYGFGSTADSRDRARSLATSDAEAKSRGAKIDAQWTVR